MEKELRNASLKDLYETFNGTAKNPVFGRDFIGRKVFVGDKVALSNGDYASLNVGIVEKITPKGIRANFPKPGSFYLSTNFAKINTD